MNRYVLPDPVLGTGVGGVDREEAAALDADRLGLESASTAAVSYSTSQRLSILIYGMVGEHPTDSHSY